MQGGLDASKAGSDQAELESDEELELALRRELTEMVRASGVSDANALLDIFIDGKSEKV